MNKTEFLASLEKKLSRMPQSEIDSALSYYDEYITDAGAEYNVPVDEIGTPAEIASKLIGEFAVNDANEPKKSKAPLLWIIILAVFSAPITLPLAITVAAVVFSLIITVFALCLAFFIAGFAVLINGIVMIIAAFYFALSSLPTFLFYSGSGLVCIGVGTAFLLGTYQLSKVTVKGIQKLLGKFLIRRSKG